MSCFCTGVCRTTGRCPNAYPFWNPPPIEPVGGWVCPNCKAGLAPWVRICPNCHPDRYRKTSISDWQQWGGTNQSSTPDDLVITSIYVGG